MVAAAVGTIDASFTTPLVVAVGLAVELIIIVTDGLIVGSFIAPHSSVGTLKHAIPVGHPSPEGQRIDKSRQFA